MPESDICLDAYVLGLRPESEYEGTVYRQMVVAQLPNGTVVEFFDVHMLAGPDTIGRRAVPLPPRT